MKKEIIVFTFLAFAFSLHIKSSEISIWNGKSTTWSQGSGTKEDPFIIESAEQLAYLSKEVNNGNKFLDQYFKLTININLSGSENANPRMQWIPIGNYQKNPFAGHFDGNRHEIFDMYVCSKIKDELSGLFGWLDKGGSIRNIGVTGDSTVESIYSAGGVIGSVYEAIVVNCYN